jgi:hypothetical protein
MVTKMKKKVRGPNIPVRHGRPADVLTGEQFKLGPDSLCIAVETKVDGILNANIMYSLREKAPRRR